MKNNHSEGASDALSNHCDMLAQGLGPIDYRSPSSLQAYDRILRNHSEKQLVSLVASIREFGFVIPVLVEENGTIIAGHARVEAAKRLGMREIPTIRISHLSKAQVKALRLAENRLGELATWNTEALVLEIEEILAFEEFPIEVLGWETAEIDVMFAQAASVDPGNDPADEIPEPPYVPVSAVGDLWLLGQHRVLCGSSLEAIAWARLMDGKTAAMSFSDAPYNVSVTKHVCGLGKVQHDEFAMASGEMSEAEFIQFLKTFLERTCACLKDGGIIYASMDWKHFLNFSPPPAM